MAGPVSVVDRPVSHGPAHCDRGGGGFRMHRYLLRALAYGMRVGQGEVVGQGCFSVIVTKSAVHALERLWMECRMLQSSVD